MILRNMETCFFFVFATSVLIGLWYVDFGSAVQASCTLEAGVKIYSLRVDSVHSEAYKVLGGINRAGQEEDEQG